MAQWKTIALTLWLATACLGAPLHRYYINTNAIPKDGEINPKGLDKVMQLLVEDGTLIQPLPKTDKYVDMSYLAEARRTLLP